MLLGVAAQGLGQLVVSGAQAVGENHRADHHGEVLVLLVVVELD